MSEVAKPSRLRAIVLGVIAALVIFALGATWAKTRAWPYKTITSMDWLVMAKRKSVGALQPTKTVSSAFTDLQLDSFDFTTVATSRVAKGGIEALGNDVVVITDRGNLFYYENTDGTPTAVTLDIETNNNFEQILADNPKVVGHIPEHFNFFDVMIEPIDNRLVMFTSQLHYKQDQSCFTMRVTKLDLDPAIDIRSQSKKAEDWSVLWDSSPCLTFPELPFLEAAGGHMAMSAEGKVILTVGTLELYGQTEGLHQAQDPARDYGKIVEIDPRSGEYRQLSIGHRNPQGVAVDDNGKIWTMEHGPQGGDELNLIEPGENHGYPLAVYGTDYGSKIWPFAKVQNSHDGFDEPFFTFLPSIGASNLIQVKGFIDEWEDDLIVASMRRNTLYRLRIREDRVLYSEPIAVGVRIRDLDQLENGKIVLWTDTLVLAEMTPRKSAELIPKPVLKLLSEDKRVLATQAIKSCLKCHSVKPFSDAETAPLLWNVVDRKIASTSFGNYSSALQNKGGRWNDAELDKFLAGPADYAPGTVMAAEPIDDPEIRGAVVAYLKTLKKSFKDY